MLHRPSSVALFNWAVFVHFSGGDAAGLLAWTNPGTLTTCQPANLTWAYRAGTGTSDDEIGIAISNYGVVQQPAPSSTRTGVIQTQPAARRAGEVTEQLTVLPIGASGQSFGWESVNVPSGWYELIATFTQSGETKASSQFFVANGADTSCLPVSSSSSQPQSTSTSATPASSSNSTATGPVVPISGTSKGGVSRGAIAGAVIGALAVVASMAAFVFYRRFSGNRRNSSGRDHWAGLDSKGPLTGGTSTVGGRHVHSESLGPIVLHDNDNSVYVLGNVARIADKVEPETDAETAHSQEKIASPSPQTDSPLSAAAQHPSVAPHPRRRASPASAPSPPPASPNLNYQLYYPPSPTPSSLPSPVLAPNPRRGSTGDALGRRIARKAVPEYNHDDPALTHSRSVTPAPSLLGGGEVHYLMPDMPAQQP
ncbi:hypothetical protein MKEN_00581100 [Mycena kentingensis (nom. inval.)]|nr:hypothetical protein MKEN_00581100 [Mycena kentingensis (nom. inval.)]